MELHFTGQNIEITDALRAYATEKFERLEHRKNKINRINITFHLENLLNVAEANCHFHGTDIHATAKDKDMYAALDMLIDRLVVQLNKAKEKITDHR